MNNPIEITSYNSFFMAITVRYCSNEKRPWKPYKNRQIIYLNGSCYTLNIPIVMVNATIL